MNHLKYSTRDQRIKRKNQKRESKEVAGKRGIQVKRMPESGNNFICRYFTHLIQVIQKKNTSADEKENHPEKVLLQNIYKKIFQHAAQRYK